MTATITTTTNDAFTADEQGLTVANDVAPSDRNGLMRGDTSTNVSFRTQFDCLEAGSLEASIMPPSPEGIETARLGDEAFLAWAKENEE